jgi:hypothetical protein
MSEQRLFSPRDIARAAKTFTYCYGLSPAARRVGLALLDHLNVHNGRCDPSEARLASLLHLTDRTVRHAKYELRRVGFLAWKSHGGLPLTSDYRFQWKAVHAACDRIEAHAKELVPRRTRGLERQFPAGMYQEGQTGNSLPQTGNSLPTRPEASFRQTNPLNYPIELYQEALKEEG